MRLRERSVTRRAFLSAGGGLAGAVLLGVRAPAAASGHSDPAQAGGTGPAPPRVYTRGEWAAVPPKSRAVVLDGAPDRIVIHHTATGNTGDPSLDAAFRLSQAIQRYHMRHNGWADIGEQFTVSRGGHIMEGRNGTLPAIAEGKHVMGAQAANHNRHTLGVENEGTYMTELPPASQLASLTALLAWLCHAYQLDPNVAIVGHRDLNPTSCPGDRLYGYLPQLRANVARRLGVRRPPAARLAVPSPPPLAVPSPPLPGAAEPFDHGPALGVHDRPEGPDDRLGSVYDR